MQPDDDNTIDGVPISELEPAVDLLQRSIKSPRTSGPISKGTARRLYTTGVGGIVVQTVCLAGGRYSHPRWIRDFCERLTQARAAGQRTNPNAAEGLRRYHERRRREIAIAHAEADAAGL